MEMVRAYPEAWVKVSWTWSPKDRRRRGRPKMPWHQMVESEWRRLGFNSWMQIKGVVKGCVKWEESACGLTHPFLEVLKGWSDDDLLVYHITATYHNMFPVLHEEDICLVCDNNFNGRKKIKFIGLLTIEKQMEIIILTFPSLPSHIQGQHQI